MYPYISKTEKAERWRRQSEAAARYSEHRKQRRSRAASAIPSRTEEAVALKLQEESPPPPSVAEEREDAERSPVDSRAEPRKERERGDGGVGRPESPTKQKKSETEATVASLISFFDKMMNKKQLLITLISFLCGAYAVYIAFFRDESMLGYESRHQSAQSMKNVLLVYGLVQLLLSTVFFLTYAATTTIGEGRGGYRIVGGVLGCIVYLLVAFVVLVAGVVGFYRVMALYGHVEYDDRQSIDYIDKVLYKSALFIFIFHICFILLKCCWWCR